LFANLLTPQARRQPPGNQAIAAPGRTGGSNGFEQRHQIRQAPIAPMGLHSAASASCRKFDCCFRLALHSADPHDGPELNNKPVLAELDVRVANACRRLFKLSLDERFFDIASR
jgi:hypothetical protein